MCRLDLEEEELLKGITSDLGEDDDDLHDDDPKHKFDDFDLDDGDEGIDMDNWEEKMGLSDSPMNAEEEKKWRQDEERFFKRSDTSRDGFLEKDEYIRAMLKDMAEGSMEIDQDRDGEVVPPPHPSSPLTTEGMTDDQKMHFKELGEQFAEEDKDRDGKISLDEWINIMFHDEPQMPEFEDGMQHMMTRDFNKSLTPEEQVCITSARAFSLSLSLSLHTHTHKQTHTHTHTHTSLPLCLPPSLSLPPTTLSPQPLSLHLSLSLHPSAPLFLSLRLAQVTDA